MLILSDLKGRMTDIQASSLSWRWGYQDIPSGSLDSYLMIQREVRITCNSQVISTRWIAMYLEQTFALHSRLCLTRSNATPVWSTNLDALSRNYDSFKSIGEITHMKEDTDVFKFRSMVSTLWQAPLTTGLWRLVPTTPKSMRSLHHEEEIKKEGRNWRRQIIPRLMRLTKRKSSTKCASMTIPYPLHGNLSLNEQGVRDICLVNLFIDWTLLHMFGFMLRCSHLFQKLTHALWASVSRESHCIWHSCIYAATPYNSACAESTYEKM